ncbi:hypothetical protein NXV81_03445 [Bacteroides ovatus]|nr:hypothetical protein [Bacteroides ovatus]
MKTETTPKAETESRTRIQAYSKSQLSRTLPTSHTVRLGTTHPP